MKPSLSVLSLLLLALALPTAASARVVEVGVPQGGELPAPSCPANPCFAVSRTTGYQAKVGTSRTLYRVPADGRLVAWSIRLSTPTAAQTAFFRERLGGAPQAGISVIQRRRRLFSRVVAKTPLFDLQPFFGQTVQFPLEESVPVKRGQYLALTVPTWAPALVTGQGGDTSWRASRAAGKCDDTETQTAQTEVGSRAQYRCLYQRVRLAYSATVITNPKPTPAERPATRRR